MRKRDRFINIDLSRRTGTVVISSSAGGETSAEDQRLGHGVFTWALLEALKSKPADRDKNGRLNITELISFIAPAVHARTAGLQNPTIDRDNRAADISLPLVR